MFDKQLQKKINKLTKETNKIMKWMDALSKDEVIVRLMKGQVINVRPVATRKARTSKKSK